MKGRFWLSAFSIFVFFSYLSAEHPSVPSATVHIPMRDGTELTADLYYPPGAFITNEYPCILLRLPAGRKAEMWLHLADLSKHGYVVAVQDTRSALDPEGKTLPYFSDGWDTQQDGLDTVNWLASSSFTNGKIGTIGFSAAGMTQLMLAPTAPPALKCQYIGQAGGSIYHHAIFSGGQLLKNQVETWLGYYAPHPSVIEHVTKQPIYNDFWQKVDALSMSHRVETPAVHYSGWYDPFLEGTIETFNARQQQGKEGARNSQKLLIGPWNHFWPMDLSLGDYHVPENGKNPPVDISAKRWFDHYLKGDTNGIADLPAVTYYVMGPVDGSISSGNVWRHAEEWPLPHVDMTMYLTHDSMLSMNKAQKMRTYSYESHPNDPIPTIGGRNLFIQSGPKDQRTIENRKDVTVFTSASFDEDVEVTGKIMANLFITSDVPNADIALRLTDVYPDGKSLLIAEGYLKHGSLPQHDEPKEVVIEMSSSSFVVAKGHSLRLTVGGSNYPKYEKTTQATAIRSSIATGPDSPSRLILPVVRKGNTWLVSPQPIAAISAERD